MPLLGDMDSDAVAIVESLVAGMFPVDQGPGKMGEERMEESVVVVIASKDSCPSFLLKKIGCVSFESCRRKRF